MMSNRASVKIIEISGPALERGRQYGEQAKAQIDASVAYYSLREAMEHFERAEALRTPGNDDAILRWNTCARIIMRNPEIRPLPHQEFQPITGE